MHRLTETQINDINHSIKDGWNQGIFKEPYGVDHVKDLVIYQRYETGGVSGGSCWDDSDPQPYTNREVKPDWEALDLVLKAICPDISYLKYKDIQALVKSTEDTDWEYYGNHTDYEITYLRLEDLYNYLNI